MLTLEEAIKQYEQFVNICENHSPTEESHEVIEQLAAELRGLQESKKSDSCDGGCVKEFDKRYLLVIKQLAAWLRELVERRKAPEIVFCKDCRKHNVKVGFDENFHTVWKEDACPLVDWRGKAKGHEFDYQYCAFAERRTDADD